MKTAGGVINMGHPQALAHRVPVRETAGEKFAGGFEAVELQREFGTLIPHAGGCNGDRTVRRFQPDRVWPQFLSISNKAIRRL
jgi:hypothetical protein